MIESADEFVRLRRSTDREEYGRAARDEASIETWRDVIERYPEMREWVAHNKSVPMEILEILRHDTDEKVRSVVRQKRSWARAHPDDSTRVQGLEEHEIGILETPTRWFQGRVATRWSHRVPAGARLRERAPSGTP